MILEKLDMARESLFREKEIESGEFKRDNRIFISDLGRCPLKVWEDLTSVKREESNLQSKRRQASGLRFELEIAEELSAIQGIKWLHNKVRVKLGDDIFGRPDFVLEWVENGMEQKMVLEAKETSTWNLKRIQSTGKPEYRHALQATAYAMGLNFQLLTVLYGADRSSIRQEYLMGVDELREQVEKEANTLRDIKSYAVSGKPLPDDWRLSDKAAECFYCIHKCWEEKKDVAVDQDLTDLAKRYLELKLEANPIEDELKQLSDTIKVLMKQDKIKYIPLPGYNLILQRKERAKLIDEEVKKALEPLGFYQQVLVPDMKKVKELVESGTVRREDLFSAIAVKPEFALVMEKTSEEVSS